MSISLNVLVITALRILITIGVGLRNKEAFRNLQLDGRQTERFPNETQPEGKV